MHAPEPTKTELRVAVWWQNSAYLNATMAREWREDFMKTCDERFARKAKEFARYAASDAKNARTMMGLYSDEFTNATEGAAS